MDTSYLTTQVTTIIGQLHSIFDEIGLPRGDRDSRETELFAALSETLNNQLRLANGEKIKMNDEAQNIINTIKQMEASLDDEKNHGYAPDTGNLRVTYPLIDCLRDLKEKYNIVSRLHRERFEQVKKLVEALESYSSHLESSFVKIKLPPTNSTSCPPTFDLSPSYVATLDEEFTRVYEEYNKRVSIVQNLAEEIVRLWSELGIPQAQTDSTIVQYYRESPEQLGLHQTDMDRLKSRRDKLQDEKKAREKRLKEIRATIEALWDRLGVQEPDRKAFLAANRGVGLRTINEFEDELARLNELKRQNLGLFVEDARVRLQELWDSLYFSEEEMLEFTPAFSDVYSDALLSAHEAEIERLTTLKDQRAPILAAIEKHKSLIGDREALVASANDASRLMLRGQKGEKRDPTRLLREEKMRKRIAKELPKVTADLVKTLQRYEEDYGRPFLVHGENYLDEIEIQEAAAPPPRSKTPNGLPPRSKTPSVATQTSKATTAKTATADTSVTRPKTAMSGPPPRSATRTPTSNRPATVRNPPSSIISQAPSSQVRSPSKIPSRVPLGNLKYGNNSPERRAAASHLPQPTHQPAAQQTQQLPQQQQLSQHNFAQSTRSMGPPRAPPPKMREAMNINSEHTPSICPPDTGLMRPPSVISSSSSQASSRYVRPMSPEDVYDDRERMSYMSASLINRDFHAQHQPQFAQSFHQHQHQLQHAPPPLQAASRQISNTSSEMTTGTTASGSENWETYSDNSDLLEHQPPDRGLHGGGSNGQYNALKPQLMGLAGGKRMAGAHPYGHMAPPPKMRIQDRMMGDGLENFRLNSVTSDAAWSTEAEETF